MCGVLQGAHRGGSDNLGQGSIDTRGRTCSVRKDGGCGPNPGLQAPLSAPLGQVPRHCHLQASEFEKWAMSSLLTGVAGGPDRQECSLVPFLVVCDLEQGASR